MGLFGKSKKKPELPVLPFKSGQAFFDMQCKFGFTDIREEQGICALVLDAAKEFGTPEAVKVQPNGCQLATLKVASEDGGFVIFAETASSSGDALRPGDVVIWVPMVHMKEMADRLGDHRQGWVGLIIAKVAPEIDPNSNEMRVLCRY
jgi:hypothetical protein